MKSIVFQTIIDNLLSNPFFSDFTFRKRYSTLICKNVNGWRAVELDHWEEQGMDMLVIYPIYCVKFNVVSKWFEKFSVKNLRDQRDNATINIDNKMLGLHSMYYNFNNNGAGFFDDYVKMESDIIDCAKYVFGNYGTLQQTFDRLIRPVIKGETELPDVGADWIFEYLTICRIISTKDYDQLKSILLKHMDWMHSRNEPNVADYYNRVDEILDCLENTQF